MKKCPYCAEEIKEEAIKCKHCGEWLSVSTENTGTDSSNIPQEELKEEDKINSVEKNIETAIPQHTDNTRYQEILGAKSLVKKPGKYGWGWFLFLGSFGTYATKNNPFSDYTLSFIWSIMAGIMPFVFLIPYFALRRKFIKMWDFPGSKAWKAGLAAGFCTYLLVVPVFGIMHFFDAKLLNSKMEKQIGALDGKYKDRITIFKQEKNKYQEKFISKPQTINDIKQNIKTIDEILAYDKKEQRFFHEMFSDYKQTLKNKRQKNGGKSWGDSIDGILSIYDKSYEKQTRAWTLLRNHYVTGEEKYYQEYTTVYRDAAQLATEFQRLARETLTANQ